jgi:hypothetical protein
MTKHRAKNAARQVEETWQGHELITKAIYEALLKQDNPQQWEIKHNIQLDGRTTKHQIDVYWRFRVADLDHFVIVQVKKEKGRAKQGDLMLFRDVLNDIPGQPKGIFVTQAGYQKGALKVARSSGITSVILSKVDRPDRRPSTILNTFSVGLLSIRLDKIAMELTFLIPHLDKLNFVIDSQWAEQHPEVWSLIQERQTYHGVQFVDGDGNVRTSLERLVQDRLKEFRDGGQTQLTCTFSEPTYLAGIELMNKAGMSVRTVKLLEITATLNIEKRITISPLFAESSATYILKNVIESNTRYVLVDVGETEPRAHVSLERTKIA